MATLGGDSHKRTHTLVVVDDNGRHVAQKTLLATSAGISKPCSGQNGGALWRTVAV